MGLRIYIGPHYLPRLTLFEPAQTGAGGWSGQTAGSALPADPAHAIVAGYRFITGPQPAGTAIFYLRVQAPGLLTLRVLAEPLEAPEHGLQSQMLWLGLQIGGLLLMAAIALGSCLLRPGRLMGRFALYALNLLLCVLAGSGLLVQHVYADQPLLDDWVFHGLWCLRLSVWMWFMSAFFEGASTPRWYRHLCLGLHAVVLACMTLVPLGWLMPMQVLALAVTVAFSLAQIVAVLGMQDIHAFYRRTLLAGFLATDALVAGTVLASVYAGGTELATHLARGLDIVAPLILLLVIAFKGRLDQQEFVRVKGALQEESLRARFHQQAVQDRKMLIDMLTHELRNPLASISFAVGSLERRAASGPSDREGRHDAGREQRLLNIQRSIQNMDSVIERCSLMNLMDQDSAIVQREPVDLADFVGDLVLDHPGHERIDLDLPHGACTVNSDRQLLRIVVGNLLENALKYSPEASRIRVALRTDLKPDGPGSAQSRPAAAGSGNASAQVGNQYVISVANSEGDHGAPDAGEVFRKFYRHPLAQAQSGSGLGLYLVREICRWLGGEASYRPPAVAGEVVFEVRLPV